MHTVNNPFDFENLQLNVQVFVCIIETLYWMPTTSYQDAPKWKWQKPA